MYSAHTFYGGLFLPVVNVVFPPTDSESRTDGKEVGGGGKEVGRGGNVFDLEAPPPKYINKPTLVCVCRWRLPYLPPPSPG